MKHTSRLFGEFEYEPSQVITFPSGLLGFRDYREYVLKSHRETDPVKWLLSVEDGGPELAIVDPAQVNDDPALERIELSGELLAKLHCDTTSKLMHFAIVTVPDNIRHMSMNLRSPIFINPETMRGIEYPKPGIQGLPVRCYIYRDLIRSRSQDELGTLVMTRKVNETVEIGDEIVVQVLALQNGGVKLGITAPKRMNVSRGNGLATPLMETKRANERMNLRQLKEVMRLHRVMREAPEDLEATLEDVTIQRDANAG